MKDGAVHEERQGHFRGGAHEPLSRADLEEKFRLNCTYGGWPEEKREAFLRWSARGKSAAVDLAAFR
jgi:2-methylcitrate dehydratase PrpD